MPWQLGSGSVEGVLSDLGRERTHNNLVHVHIVGLLDGELDGSADGIGSDSYFAIRLHALARDRVADGVGEFRCHNTRIRARATDFVAFLSKPFRNCAHSKLRRGLDGGSRLDDEPADGGHIDNMALASGFHAR